MGMDGLPMDEHGNWLYPLISWHCPRTEPQFDWWVEQRRRREDISRSAATTLWRFNTALRLLWMAEHEPEILKRTHKWLLIEDFVNFMLCGRYATDYSMASCTLLFDQRKLTGRTKSWGCRASSGGCCAMPSPAARCWAR